MKASMSTPLSCLLEKKSGFTYEFFHGPGGARTQGLADQEQDSDMKGVVKSITYGDLWADHKKHAKTVGGGPPGWLTTAYEGLVHFH